MTINRWIAAVAAVMASSLAAAGVASAQGTTLPEPGMGAAPMQVPSPSATPVQVPAPSTMPGPVTTPAPSTQMPITAPPETPSPAEPPITPAEAPPPPPEVIPPMTAPPHVRRRRPLPPGALGAENPYGWYMPQSRFGMSIMLGGGVSDFTNSAITSNTGTGGAWDLRLVFGTRLWFGGEVAYVGAAQSINNLGLASSSTLVRNGIEGVLRINAPLHAGQTLLEPYIFGGVGWNLYDVNASTATADLNVSDNTLSVPAGTGFTVGYQGFMADIRGTYRPTTSRAVHQTADTALTTGRRPTIGYSFSRQF
jgi:hypothetical protein